MLLAKEEYASILFGQEKTVFFEFLGSQEASKHVSDKNKQSEKRAAEVRFHLQQESVVAPTFPATSAKHSFW